VSEEEAGRRDALASELAATLKRAPAEVLARLDSEPSALQEDPEFLYLRGIARWRTAGPRHACAPLRRAIARDPAFADARYALGEVLHELEDHRGQVEQWMALRRLDARADRARGRGSRELRRRIVAVAEALLARVPAELRARMGNVALVLEPRPGRALVEEGFDPRALGLFEGPDDQLTRSIEAPPEPSRIVLFYMNLEVSFPEFARLDEEVEITILHELGHYFGLDEAGVARLGLD
jgi:predicted Zn-dependent protease with MMP-like domain